MKKESIMNKLTTRMNLRKNKKGFTLVEIIVVLIIIAILAAAAIPAMTKYIDDARGKAILSEARAAYVAAEYVFNKTNGESLTTVIGDSTYNSSSTNAGLQFIKDTAEYCSLPIGNFTVTVSGGKITKLVYTSGGYNATIEPGKSATVTK